MQRQYLGIRCGGARQRQSLLFAASVVLLSAIVLVGGCGPNHPTSSARNTPVPSATTDNGSTVTPATSPSAPPVPLPASLRGLGFTMRTIGGVAVILPPLQTIPAGSFLMGSDAARDPQAQSDEQPQTSIYLPALQMGTFEVTVAEYALAVQAQVVPAPGAYVSWDKQLRAPDHPVISVTWTQAVAYAAWLSKLTGNHWRLPTEAEWEKAARGTDGRIYPWGDQWDQTRANTYEGGLLATTAVGTYPNGASPYGVQDMAGNTYQWCNSLFKAYPYNANDGREVAVSTNRRVLRNASYFDFAQNARTAARGSHDPDDDGEVGLSFRLALSAS